MSKSNGEISITFMSGPRDGEKMTFEQPERGKERIITIGRRETCSIHLGADNQVSRLHATLGCESVEVTSSESITSPYMLQFWLEDGSSRNGTFVEKMHEPIKSRVTLRPGILFRIGRTWLRLDVPMSF